MGVYNGTVPTFLPGELPDGDKFDEISDFMTAMTGAWTSYTPTWTASAGAVAIGNGSLAGAYRRIGKTVDFRMLWVAGSTTTFGTAGAHWSFGLPPLGNTAGAFAWPLRMLDAGTLEYAGIAATGSDGVASGSIELFKPVSGRIVNNSPFTPANGDKLWVSGTYELA